MGNRASKQRKWQKLSCKKFRPNDAYDCKHITPINDYEFIIAPNTGRNYVGKNANKLICDGIYKYNTKTNKWSLIMKYPDIIIDKLRYHCMTFNNITNEIYLYGYIEKTTGDRSTPAMTLVVIDINTTAFEVFPIKPQSMTKSPWRSKLEKNMPQYLQQYSHQKSLPEKDLNIYNLHAIPLVVDGKLCLFGGHKSNQILIWNEDTRSFTKLMNMAPCFNFLGGVTHFGLLYSSIYGKIYIIGGHGYKIGDNMPPVPMLMDKSMQLNHITEYCLKTKKWTTIKDCFDEGVSSFGCTLSNDEKYILIFAPGSTTDIIIFNVENGLQSNGIKSNIKCPGYYTIIKYSAIIMNDSYTHNLLIAGFIKKKININNQDISNDIIQIVMGFCNVSSYVHLVSKEDFMLPGNGNKHHRISVDALINSI